MTGLSSPKKRLVAGFFALALVIAIGLVAATSGLGRPSVPSGAVAIVDGVDDGTVTDEQYQRALEQAAARLGLDEVPPEDDPQYAQLNDEAMQGLLLAIWAKGEASDRSLDVDDADIQGELDSIQEGFQNPREFERVVRQSKFCTQEEIDNDTPPVECADVVRQGELLALQRRLSEDFASEPEVTEKEIERFYDLNAESFQTPASRTARVILNEDQAEVERARAELEGLQPGDDGYGKAWAAAAKAYSQDQASKNRGGLLEGLVEGQGDPELEAAVFSAGQGELVGPFETGRGFYVVQVIEVTEASTQPLDEAREAIRQQLTAGKQQAAQTKVQNDFITKWTRRTKCIETVEMQFCSGFVPPEPEPIPGQPEQPQPPPVQSAAPIEPGTAQLPIDGSTQTGAPQGPQLPLPEVDPAAGGVEGLPPGAVPVGPDGAPAPGGAGAAAPPPGATP